jgi:chaperonin GroEL|tara:strand:+ start:242 stop:1834 length:1593 start_codon:yes stop_codon:yes gene_type:complete
MIDKIIVHGPEAREKLLSGVEKLTKYVGATMGPAGVNWVIQQKYSAPQIHNDGANVARHIYLKDETEDMAVQTMVDICMNTDSEGGDGTSTATVIAGALIKRGYEDADLQGKNVVELAREIYQELPKVVEMLRKVSKKLGKGDLYKVVSTSLRDWELGRKVSEMLTEVGVDGRIAVEENWETKRETTFEMTKGMKFLGKIISPYLATEVNGAVWKDTPILVTNQKLESVAELQGILFSLKEKKVDKFVIINGFSEGTACYSKKFLTDTLRLRMKQAKTGEQYINWLPIEAPSLTTEQLKDVAIYTNAILYDTTLNMDVKDAKWEDLGKATEVANIDDTVHITGGMGKVKTRIAELKKKMDKEADVMFKNKIRNQIASLNSAQGKILVGAGTEAERTYKQEKITDAINAGRAAMEEGVIKGGGVPLKDIAKKLGKGHVLYEALMAPYETIQANAGGNLKIKPEIVDAFKVTRLAFENACSASAQLIATGGAITDRRQTLMDIFQSMVTKAMIDPVTDFRDDSNQDPGKPTT